MSRRAACRHYPRLGWLILLAAAALVGCERPADEVEPTPSPLEVELPGRLGPPLIKPVRLPPTDPGIPPPPDPRDPALPPLQNAPHLPATESGPIQGRSDTSD